MSKHKHPQRPQSESYRNNQRRGAKYAHGMRHNPTLAEKALARALTLRGFRFHAQHCFISDAKLYIVDFLLFCHGYQLVVEVDGKNHKKQQEYDTKRTEWLVRYRNCRILRFTNEQVLTDTPSVITAIAAHNPKPPKKKWLKRKKRNRSMAGLHYEPEPSGETLHNMIEQWS